SIELGLTAVSSGPLIRQALVFVEQLQQALSHKKVPACLAIGVTLGSRRQTNVLHLHLRRSVVGREFPDDRAALPLLLVVDPVKIAIRDLPRDFLAQNYFTNLEVHEGFAEPDRELIVGIL